MIPLPRTCKVRVPPMVGGDVDAHARAMHRFLKDGQLAAFEAQPDIVRRTWGIGKRTLAKKCAARLGLPQYGVLGPNLYAELREAKAYDALADARLREYLTPPYPSLVFPIDVAWASAVPIYLHETGGVRGNYALDWMTEPGAPVLAPEAGTVSRTAGHDPRTGLHGANRDVFGWSVYLRSTGGFFYMTHMGRLAVRGGDKLRAGDLIGYVGDWHRDRPRSHLHCGYTSFTYLSSVSIRKIRAVASAPRVNVRSYL